MVRGKVAALSPTQHAAAPLWRERWCELGRTTTPADRSAAAHAIADMYRAARLPSVPHVIWCGSPLSLALARALLLDDTHEDWPRADIPDGVWQSARAAVESTRALVHGEIGRPVSANVWDGSRETRRVRLPSWPQLASALAPAVSEVLQSQIVDRVRVAVWTSIWGELPSAVWAGLCAVAESRYPDSAAQATTAVERMWRNLPWELVSAHDQVGTLAALEYLQEACSAAIGPESGAALRLARSAGWALGCERVCWVSERPNLLRLDGQQRLHCADGPALGFPDGWLLHFWRGARVPAAWIEQRERIEPSLALTWPNIEQRRILAEILGWELVLAQLPTRVVDEAGDPAIGTLLECELPDLGRCRFLRVLCATGRTFVLSVPPNCATARQANAWTYGLDGDGYELEVRT